MILLQAAADAAQAEASINLFTMVMKGGWIMIPLFVLFGFTIFFMVDTWVVVQKLRTVNPKWFAHLISLIHKGDTDKALEVAGKSESALGQMAVAAIQSADLPEKNLEEDMQVEARQALAKSEGAIGYLSMIAAIAPMLGFLGTIFGVIKIFFNISLTNDLSISSISDGLYQKMICSGTGLLVGIIAYVGYYVLNRRIEMILLTLDKGGNELLKAIVMSRQGKSSRV